MLGEDSTARRDKACPGSVPGDLTALGLFSLDGSNVQGTYSRESQVGLGRFFMLYVYSI